MKKIIALSILLLSAVAFVPAAEAKANNVNNLTTNNSAEPQIRIRVGQNRRRYNQRRAVTQTRTVRRGRALYRETYRTTYLPNGRVNTRLISRVLIRRY